MDRLDRIRMASYLESIETLEAKVKALIFFGLLLGFCSEGFPTSFEMSRSSASTVLYFSLSTPSSGSFQAWSIRGDGRVTVTEKTGTIEAKSWETSIPVRELHEIVTQAIDSGLAEWDIEAIAARSGFQHSLDAFGRRKEAIVVFQFESLQTANRRCRQCESWIRFEDIEGAARRFPAIREFAGLQGLSIKMSEIARMPPSAAPASPPHYDWPPDPEQLVVEVTSTGFNTGRRGTLKVYGDGRLVAEDGFTNGAPPRRSRERQLTDLELQVLRRDLLFSVECDGSCIQAKLLQAQAGRRMAIEDGSRGRFTIALRESSRSTIVLREIQIDNSHVLAARFPQVLELRALANLIDRVWAEFADRPGESR